MALRVAIHQPALPKYRIPVFQELNANSDIEVTLFFGRQSNLDNVDATGFNAIPNSCLNPSIPGLGEFFWDRTQLRICGDKSWDVIVLVWNTRFLSLLPALMRARYNKIPTIVWGHGYSKRAGFFRNLLRNFVARFSDALLLYDPQTRDALAEQLPDKHCFAAPNAIDQRPIQHQIEHWTESKLAEFQRNNELNGRDLVLFVSRLDPQNELHVLVEAIDRIREKSANILCVIVGKGQDQEALENLIVTRKLKDHVRLVGPIYEEHDIAPWFMSAKVFCYPSNVGLSLLHAFGYGIPVVLGDDFSKCNPEIYAFRDQHNGMTFKNGSSDHLAETLGKLIGDDDLRNQLSKNASDTVKTVASLDQMVSGFVEAIDDVYGRSKPDQK